MTIGELAATTGVPASTIRYWERKGLLTPPPRVAGRRRYPDSARTRIAVLRLCQDSGWTLAEIRAIFELRAHNPSAWPDLVRDKVSAIDANIERLTHARAMLAHALECEYPDIAQCPQFRREVEARLGRDVANSPASTGAAGHTRSHDHLR